MTTTAANPHATAAGLMEAGYRLHHIAAARGYTSRVTPEGRVAPYVGRFGEGVKRTLPRWDTTRFVWVEYWVK